MTLQEEIFDARHTAMALTGGFFSEETPDDIHCMAEQVMAKLRGYY